jgi:Cu/Ag efflux protein CusF
MKNPGFPMIAACVVGTLCLATVALAQEAAKPAAPPKGEAVVSSTEVTATVLKVDQKTREITLRKQDGTEYSFVAGDAVKNLAQVNVGDVVVATYTEAIAYEVKKGGTAVGAETTMGAKAAALGEKPAGAVGQKTTVTVTITAIDAKVPSVTFKGPEGNSQTIKVKYPEKLKGVNIGDTVELTYAEALAIRVEKAPKK